MLNTGRFMRFCTENKERRERRSSMIMPCVCTPIPTSFFSSVYLSNCLSVWKTPHEKCERSYWFQGGAEEAPSLPEFCDLSACQLQKPEVTNNPTSPPTALNRSHIVCKFPTNTGGSWLIADVLSELRFPSRNWTRNVKAPAGRCKEGS